MPDTFLCNKCGAPTLGPDPTGGLQDLCPRCVLGFAMDGEAALAVPPPEPPGLKPGSTLGAYEILGLLGRGGMGVVYKARHTKLGRMVALKVLSPTFASDPEFVGRFSREAKALASLSHPNIVSVHDAGVEGDLPFLAMEYIDGVSLRKLLGERTLPPEEALLIVPQLCDALEYAHEKGVVHRDIKPENILIDKTGAVKIADFGLAKMVRGHETQADRLTKTNVVMGTPHYMAPEQVENPTKVDHRADIYSMGVVFYEMLTGELPIGRFHPPSRKARTGGRLDQIVMKSLEKAPDERYQRASHVKSDLGLMRGPHARERSPEHTPLPLLSTLAVVLSGLLAIVLAGQLGARNSEIAAFVACGGMLAGLACTVWRAWIDPLTARGAVKAFTILSVVISVVVAIVLVGNNRDADSAAAVAAWGIACAMVAAMAHAWKSRQVTGESDADATSAASPAGGRRVAERVFGAVIILVGIWLIRGQSGILGMVGGVAAIIGGASMVWKSTSVRGDVTGERRSIPVTAPMPARAPLPPAPVSRTAVAGLLLSASSIALALLTIIGALATGLEGGPIFSAALIGSFLLAIPLGSLVSLVGLVLIAASGGTRRGMGYAFGGLALAGCWVVIGPVVFLAGFEPQSSPLLQMQLPLSPRGQRVPVPAEPLPVARENPFEGLVQLPAGQLPEPFEFLGMETAHASSSQKMSQILERAGIDAGERRRFESAAVITIEPRRFSVSAFQLKEGQIFPGFTCAKGGVWAQLQQGQMCMLLKCESTDSEGFEELVTHFRRRGSFGTLQQSR